MDDRNNDSPIDVFAMPDDDEIAVCTRVSSLYFLLMDSNSSLLSPAAMNEFCDDRQSRQAEREKSALSRRLRGLADQELTIDIIESLKAGLAHHEDTETTRLLSEFASVLVFSEDDQETSLLDPWDDDVKPS